MTSRQHNKSPRFEQEPKQRRQFLGGSMSLAGAAMPGFTPLAGRLPSAESGPGDAGAADWTRLKQAVGGRLLPVTLPHFDDPALRKLLGHPFHIGDRPGLTQNDGWLDAWRPSPSTLSVRISSL